MKELTEVRVRNVRPANPAENFSQHFGDAGVFVPIHVALFAFNSIDFKSLAGFVRGTRFGLNVLYGVGQVWICAMQCDMSCASSSTNVPIPIYLYLFRFLP